jgi:hypothetical protein
VSGVPTLIILEADGSVKSQDGRALVAEDQEAFRYPW